VQVLSSFIDDDAPPADSIPGTMIVSEDELIGELEGLEMERQLITGIAADKNDAKVTLTRIADRPARWRPFSARWPKPTSTST
jgi:aspartate kinase